MLVSRRQTNSKAIADRWLVTTFQWLVPLCVWTVFCLKENKNYDERLLSFCAILGSGNWDGCCGNSCIKLGADFMCLFCLIRARVLAYYIVTWERGWSGWDGCHPTANLLVTCPASFLGAVVTLGGPIQSKWRILSRKILCFVVLVPAWNSSCRRRAGLLVVCPRSCLHGLRTCRQAPAQAVTAFLDRD